ncbi:HAD family hydrolase [Nesterenkonia lacusekhoensis]|uniref:HAD superfamily hydrolase (TIGR01509 family) n=1 Tax=Nesterenkonia lacusekhoensis TaxID=150832 RepID=A0ABS4T3I7_9MICC|nr:HAD superfamily hydrolase (TIGR01509 family) [Nesterenkonia lacusekhoensis]
MSAGLTLTLDTGEGSYEVQVTGAVFDCDGLLVDSESIWLQMLAAWLGERGVPADGVQTVRPEDFLGMSVHDTAASLSEMLGDSTVPGEERIAAELTERYSALLAQGVEPMPGAVELISELAARFPVAVASNGLRQDVRAMLEQVGILEKVTTVCTLDDVLYGKPEPELYLTAVGRLGIDPGQAVAFEDSPAGVESARRAGLTVVGVNHSETVELPGALRLNDLHQVSIRAPA